MKNLSRIDVVEYLVHVVGLVTVLAVMGYVMIHYEDYVYKFHALSFFSTSGDFCLNQLQRPASAVFYVGRFLTQCCHVPLLGVLLYLGLVLACGWFARKTLICRRGHLAWVVVPVVLQFLFIFRLGYRIYLYKDDAALFVVPLGFLSMLFCLWVLQQNLVRRFVAPCLVALIGYPLFGAYSLLAMVLHIWQSLISKTLRRDFLSVCLAMVLVLAVPCVYYVLFYTHTDVHYLWLQGLPHLNFLEDMSGWWPLLASYGACMLICALTRLPLEKYRYVGVCIAALVYVSSAWTLRSFVFRNLHFHRQVSAERALESHHWQELLRLTTSMPVTNDVLVAYRNIALFHTGQLVEECTRHSFATTPVVLGKNVYNSSLLAGPSIFFYSGFTNFAARWASELNLFNGVSVERLKILVLTAILNKEYAVAEKYLVRLHTVPFCGKWVERHRRMIRTGKVDDFLAGQTSLQQTSNTLFLPSGQAAHDVVYAYNFSEGENKSVVEWRMAIALITKTSRDFETLYAHYVRQHDEVPECVRYARLLFAAQSRDSALLDYVRQDLGTATEVVRSFDRCQQSLPKPTPDVRSYLHYYYYKHYEMPN